ncbi:hypothetical protein ACOSP7_023148 [Xanthoceras sorbifolium]|uniref:Remorin C-terminal domain-containing protein n=1 Tax=Xanthoceras sorbifolium TaxID=99658 RepID=A0ABQ8HQF8_9ROSI|nr:hypothetical protein JRO89_XS08G0194400 [Xanthoceras sorbifolium]
MKRSLVSSNSLGTFPSPGVSKGWSSERVPHPTNNSSRRHISAAASTPFCSGRALPSKWEDAERWICSPVSGYTSTATNKSLSNPPQFQRRPKSKSGPIVPPPMGHYSSYSPAMHVLDAASVRNFLVGSPFSTGVLVPDGVSVNYSVGGDGGGGHGYLMQNGIHVRGWSDLASEDSLPSSQDEKLDENTDAENIVSHGVSRRDMATQMSPEDSTHSSPRVRSSLCPSPPSILPVVESQSDHPAKMEVREVQVDKGATIISWSKRHGSRRIKKGVPDFEDFYQSATGTCKSSWDISEAATSISKLQREEAKITAWENLQKAKAEAAIRKLEMKLEKKRAHSMDKILNKLKSAQMKVQEMRSSITTSARQDVKIPKASHKVRFFHKYVQMSSLRGCFTCHAT